MLRNYGAIRYRLSVYEDRARTKAIFHKSISKTSLDWTVPEVNHMYFIGIAVIDEHVAKNPDTWYPETVGNFVLVPKGQYGWYGVVIVPSRSAPLDPFYLAGGTIFISAAMHVVSR